MAIDTIEFSHLKWPMVIRFWYFPLAKDVSFKSETFSGFIVFPWIREIHLASGCWLLFFMVSFIYISVRIPSILVMGVCSAGDVTQSIVQERR